MYHGVGVTLPTCAPPDIIAMAARDCAGQIRGIGALPGAWAQYNPCNVAGLPPCSGVSVRALQPTHEGVSVPYDTGEEGGGGGGEEEDERSGAFAVGGILLLLVAAGGGYYMYRRAKRKRA